MSANTYIEELLEQVQRDAQLAKSAADEDDKKKSEEKDEKEDKDGEGDDDDKKKSLPPWLKGKEASDPFADLPDHVKAACAAKAFTRLEAARSERELIFGHKQASQDLPEQVQREIFDAAFTDHLDKLAAVDPEFAAVLYEDEIKAAFNQGYAEVAAGQ